VHQERDLVEKSLFLAEKNLKKIAMMQLEKGELEQEYNMLEKVRKQRRQLFLQLEKKMKDQLNGAVYRWNAQVGRFDIT